MQQKFNCSVKACPILDSVDFECSRLDKVISSLRFSSRNCFSFHRNGFIANFPVQYYYDCKTFKQKKPLVPAVLLTTISPPITSINISITLMLVLMTYYLMSHITPLPQLSHANALAAKPNMPTFIWIILLLSTYPVALYLPTRYLSFHVDSLSALLHDISTGRKFQPTFTTFLGACD